MKAADEIRDDLLFPGSLPAATQNVFGTWISGIGSEGPLPPKISLCTSSLATTVNSVILSLISQDFLFGKNKGLTGARCGLNFLISRCGQFKHPD